jgi:hypothetical protein
MDQKKCSCCSEIRSLTEFDKCSSRDDGLQSACKTCKKEYNHKRYKTKRNSLIAQTLEYRRSHMDAWKKYSAEYRRKNKVKTRGKKILSKYNLTLEDYDRIFLGQNKRCKICGRKDFAPKIDHDHVTGKVRGILCTNCNTGLGNFKDRIDLLELAIIYLRQCK